MGLADPLINLPKTFSLQKGVIEMLGFEEAANAATGFSGGYWWKRCGEDIELRPTSLFIYDQATEVDLGCLINVKYDNGWFVRSEPERHCNELLAKQGCFYLKYSSFSQSTGFFRFEDTVTCIGLRHGPSTVTSSATTGFARMHLLWSRKCGYLERPVWNEKGNSAPEKITYSYFVIKRNSKFALLTPMAASLGVIYHAHASNRTYPVSSVIGGKFSKLEGTYTGLEVDDNAEFWHISVNSFVSSQGLTLELMLKTSNTLYDMSGDTRFKGWERGEPGDCDLIVSATDRVHVISRKKRHTYCDSLSVHDVALLDVAREVFDDERTSWYSEMFSWITTAVGSLIRSMVDLALKLVLSNFGFESIYYMALGLLLTRLTGSSVLSFALVGLCWAYFG